jgi:hypothetical protein
VGLYGNRGLAILRQKDAFTDYVWILIKKGINNLIAQAGHAHMVMVGINKGYG